MAALWYPELHQPVYVCVQRGSCWHPERLTFVGDFDDRHPGRWVPVMWQPAPLIHLMQASEVPGRVHVLHESREGVVPLRLTSQISRLDIAEELHSLAACISVLGATPEDETVPMQLRDGDIVLDSFMYEAECDAECGCSDRPATLSFWRCSSGLGVPCLSGCPPLKSGHAAQSKPFECALEKLFFPTTYESESRPVASRA